MLHVSGEQGAGHLHEILTARGFIVLEVKGLAKYFGGLKAVDDVDIEVRRGGVHALIGPNGSGKTTTLNLISGYYPPEAGEVALDDRPLDPGKPESRARRGIARTFQTPRIIGEASVLQNVMIGGTIEGKGTFLRIS